MIIDASTIDVTTRLDLYEMPKRMMDAVTRRDVEQYIGCFTEDGVWDPQPLARVATGRSDIKKAFNDAWDTLKWAFQGHYHTVIVSFDGSSAQLRTYLLELGDVREGPGDPPPVGLGMYTDDLVLDEGKWRITRHDLTTIYFGSGDFARPLFEKFPG